MLICKTRSRTPASNSSRTWASFARADQMDAGDWIALGGVGIALVFQSVGVAIFLTRVASQGQTNADAIKDLLRTRVSVDEIKAINEHLGRLDRGASECEGRITGMRVEFESRTERLSSRVTSHEQQQTASIALLQTSMAKFEAVFTAGLQSLKESVDRLHAERAAAAPAQADFITQLQQFAAVQKMLKGAAA